MPGAPKMVQRSPLGFFFRLVGPGFCHWPFHQGTWYKTQSQGGPKVGIQVQKTSHHYCPFHDLGPILHYCPLPYTLLPQHTPLSPLAPASPLGPGTPGKPGQPRRMVSLLEPSRSRTFTSAEQYKHQLVLASYATCLEGNCQLNHVRQRAVERIISLLWRDGAEVRSSWDGD